MIGFKEIPVENGTMDKLLKPFTGFDENWALVTAGTATDRGKYNMMTISWGGLGILWNKIVATVYIRPNRFTHTFTQRLDTMTVSFFPEQYKDALSYCGNHSGIDYDKAKETGLTPVCCDPCYISFKQADIILELKKLYTGKITEKNFADTSLIEKNYPRRDFHTVYICEIVKALVKE